MMPPCEQVGEAPAVWIKRGDDAPLTFSASDTITIDVARVAKATGWARPAVEVVGDSGQNPTSGYRWPSLPTDVDTEPTFEPPEGGRSVSRLIVKLLGLTREKPVKSTLAVELTVGGRSQKIDAPVDLTAEPPRITVFRARPSIVRPGDPLTFEVECERASSWTIVDASGKQVAASAGTTKTPARHWMQSEDESPFRLTAEGAGGKQTASVAARLQGEGWISAPQRWTDGQVAALCPSPRGDVLYALVRAPGGSASVWWSADGFGRWEELAEAPRNMVTTAPAACLAVQSGVKLVFAGGSKVDPMLEANTVWALDVKTKAWSTFPQTWEPRKGHACVVARDHDGTDKLWVIGGTNRMGNALRDVQVSADGEHWAPRPAPPWAARCMFAATVKESGSELWVGGGFKRFDGVAVNDVWIWRWDTEAGRGNALKWLPTDEKEGWRLSALALVTLDEKVHVAGVERQIGSGGPSYRTFFGPLNEDNSGYVRPAGEAPKVWSETAENARLEAVAFNGCIWLFSQRALEDHVVASRGLYYWVPPRRDTAF
jgi:hypothetical protein